MVSVIAPTEGALATRMGKRMAAKNDADTKAVFLTNDSVCTAHSLLAARTQVERSASQVKHWTSTADERCQPHKSGAGALDTQVPGCVPTVYNGYWKGLNAAQVTYMSTQQ